MQLGVLGERCKLPSGVWGRAPVEIEFCALNLTPGGVKFTNLSENRLTTVCQQHGKIWRAG